MTNTAKPKAKPRSKPVEQVKTYGDPPKTLKGHIFYGMTLDEDQEKFRDAIWDPEIEIVFCNSIAGSGKTLVALGTANLLVKHNFASEIYYMMAAGCFEKAQGYLPGNVEKNLPYTQPLYQAAIKLGINPYTDISDDTMIQKKKDTAYIFPLTDSYIRGLNIGDPISRRAITIIDEAQNYTEYKLRSALTRCTGKTIVIGHTLQCDLDDPDSSGFQRCIDHFMSKNDGKAAYVELTNNYRGYVSRVADEKWDAGKDEERPHIGFENGGTTECS